MATDNSDQMPLVISILAVILAVVAIIIGAVSISQRNNYNIVSGRGGKLKRLFNFKSRFSKNRLTN